MNGEGLRRVSHPILRLDVVDAEGKRQSSFRVFCRKKQRPVPIGVCYTCVHAESVESGPNPTLNCLIPSEDVPDVPDPLGLRTPVGVALRKAVYAVAPDMAVRDAFDLLRAEERLTLTVVDDEHTVIGTLDDVRCDDRRGRDAGTAMSSKLTLGALVPVRRALELMAAAHLREITIVDEAGVPIGVFRDVDGLTWLANAKRRA